MKEYNNSFIEHIATNAVEKEMLKYPKSLMPYIGKNDKTPIWDGQVFVYKDYEQKKLDFEYKIDLQIKGRHVERLSNGNIKYPVKVEDIKGYQKVKTGTLYFVVEFIDIDNYRIYYKNFLPLDIKEELEKIKEKDQKTISCLFRPVVESTQSSINRICLNFVQNSRIQSNIKIKNVDIEKLNVSTIKIPLIDDYSNYEEYLKSPLIDKYLYATLSDGNEVVLPKLFKLYKTIDRKLKIYVNNKLYYNKFDILENGEDVCILIGKSTKLFFDFQNKKIEFDFKICGTLFERINDINFIIDFVSKKQFILEEYGEIKLPIKIDSNIYSYVRKIKKVLKIYQQIQDMLINTGFIKYIKDIQLTPKDINQLLLLLEYYKGNIKDGVSELNSFRLEIHGKYLYFIYIYSGEKYRVYDTFSNISDKVVCFINNGENQSITSFYTTLNKNDLIDAINFNCEEVYSSIINIKMSQENLDAINNFILQLLLAYDDTKNKDFMELAEKIGDKSIFLYNNPIYKINYYQIIKRQRTFNDNELDELYEIREENINNCFIQLGIAILLENKSDFIRYWKKLSDDEKKVIITMPIYNIQNFSIKL